MRQTVHDTIILEREINASITAVWNAYVDRRVKPIAVCFHHRGWCIKHTNYRHLPSNH
ncbi:MAG: hypothetical protein L0K07_02955 [Yaniella sp.]|uniref:hypothetical protein n=1 Tax=Yaniella sp. TaxID=2773929 RepID=UPI0026499195|nr:hypothetical protein [Yaniella sp.]MDN5732370.1 hypothetical protein [Yaniella sp.]MDN6410340.1 hypothetical protein [Yaniella sp.]MDN6499958.1 hypothetical protein [Yaniella sp.]MDN6520653.1 hypothetical protein [Yaniella sp.]